jgi:hypothetical protein
VIDPNVIAKVSYLCRVEPFLASRLALRQGIFIEGAISGFMFNMYPYYSRQTLPQDDVFDAIFDALSYSRAFSASI